MTDVGVATRVHGRADDALEWYRLYRNFYISNRRSSNWLAPIQGAVVRDLVHAMMWRSRWSALREIIDAEERRAKVAAA